MEELTDVEPTKSSPTEAEGPMRVSFPVKTGVDQSSVEARGGKGDGAARGEHGKRPDHDSGTSG